MKFTYIPDKLNYPSKYKGKLSTAHSAVVEYVATHFQNKYKFRQHVIDVMNSISCVILSGDDLSSVWKSSDPLEFADIRTDSFSKEFLGNLYLSEKNIQWDVDESEVNNQSQEQEVIVEVQHVKPVVINPTPKQDLYLKPPVVPQFDVNDIWASGSVDGNSYVIYKSLPIVPTKQSEISATTDIMLMDNTALCNLYPNRVIPTRPASLYSHEDGLVTDDLCGLILPTCNFTEEQLKQNLIEYPHLFKLYREVDGKIVSFYSYIELDGQLYKTLDVWDSLPDAQKIPKNIEYIKEYVVRRYLLERDIQHVDHKYEMYGTLNPFLTLFMPMEDYKNLGYDIIDLAKKCVNARVSYKRSRNPILRRLQNV